MWKNNLLPTLLKHKYWQLLKKHFIGTFCWQKCEKHVLPTKFTLDATRGLRKHSQKRHIIVNISWAQ